MKIVVLMSSYNGEKFIREQIDSILNQDIAQTAELSLLVRDDGSSDSTHVILNEYQEKGELTWYTGKNLRPAKSFWHLVQQAPQSDFYAFCDQDDVWFSDKLSRAVARMTESGKMDKPLLYCSSVTVTDAELSPTGQLSASYRAVDDFAYSLIYSVAPGCTFVFNDSARQEMLRYDMEQQYPLIHDWLAHKIITMKGTLLHDNEPSMFYRQHGNNVIGSQHSGLRGMWERVRRFGKGTTCVRSRVAQALLNVYGADLASDGDQYRYLNMVANYKHNRHLKHSFLREKTFRTGTMNDRFLYCLIVTGKI